ncbi:MAG: hypothetical protein R6X20_10735 [Phycisphaerae bacterium]
MPGRIAASILLLAWLGLGGFHAGGCASLTDPFLGVPEWQTVHYGDETPDPALRGVPRITAVEERAYTHYVQAASTGRLVAREVRGGWIYYAVATRRAVRVPGADPSGPHRAVAVVYERYRARQPAKPAPKPRFRLPDQESTPPEEAIVIQPGTEAEEMRKRIEERLEKRNQEQGGPKIISPESSDDVD